jgi:hypothetical protein
MLRFQRARMCVLSLSVDGQLLSWRDSIYVFVFVLETIQRNSYRGPAAFISLMESESVLQRPILPDDLPEDIHHSIADADDLEEVWDEEISIGDVFRNVLHHPGQLVTRWNWKSVMLAVMVRGAFYFTIYKLSRESWLVTMTAVLVEFLFRFLTAGVFGALVQSFRRARPIWAANLIVSILLPACSHSVEFVTHYVQEKYLYDIFAASENSGRQRTFAISVLFSVVSVLFNLYAMRNGVLLVGAGSATKSFISDLKQLPRLVGEFTASLPVLVAKFIEKGQLHYALGTFLGFGAAVGSILGTFRGKWEWAWRSALGAWALLFAVVLLTLFVRVLLRRKGTLA